MTLPNKYLKDKIFWVFSVQTRESWYKCHPKKISYKRVLVVHVGSLRGGFLVPIMRAPPTKTRLSEKFPDDICSRYTLFRIGTYSIVKIPSSNISDKLGLVIYVGRDGLIPPFQAKTFFPFIHPTIFLDPCSPFPHKPETSPYTNSNSQQIYFYLERSISRTHHTSFVLKYRHSQ